MFLANPWKKECLFMGYLTHDMLVSDA